MNFVKILEMNEAAEKLACSAIIQYGLLPTDASIASLMISNNIIKILTGDSDFKKLKSVEVIEV